eukprot:TRINITY_DN2741_c0_g1_i1.p1 TRINITY_DN2741_c0_g1~~TRINITY_DN2741_c0_g1_i1.p1  ORF type:complete len:325 (+),score=43.77 TRINITY_DN2741_c0_g1_i1:94-1068(+)
MDQYRSVKVLLVGNGGTGKTTFLKRLLQKEFEPKYVPTLGVEVHPFLLQTTKGPLVFSVWDTAGQEKFGGLRDGYFIQAQAGIIFFDLDSPNTLRSAKTWLNDLRRVAGRIPLVLVGNKSDIEERKISSHPISQFLDANPYFNDYVELSVKSQTNITTPFLILARALLTDTSVEFLESPGLLPPILPTTNVHNPLSSLGFVGFETPLPSSQVTNFHGNTSTSTLKTIEANVLGSGLPESDPESSIVGILEELNSHFPLMQDQVTISRLNSITHLLNLLGRHLDTKNNVKLVFFFPFSFVEGCEKLFPLGDYFERWFGICQTILC